MDMQSISRQEISSSGDLGTPAGYFAASFATLRSLPCNFPLGAHASFFDFEDKHAALVAGDAANPFVDPQAYRAYVERKEASFRAELERQRAEGAGAATAHR